MGETAAASEETVAQAIGRGLFAAGVRRIYGLPGEDHLRLLDALQDSGLTYIGARDESAAALMAATEAQATGLPGVVVVTIAPGVTNALNGIAHAFLDGVPLLVITGQHGQERAPLIVRQMLDNHRLLESVTRWTTSVSQRVHQVLARALDTALAPPRGPVLLEVRDEIAARPALDDQADWPVLQASGRTWRPRRVDVDWPTDLLDRVRGAARPVLVVGGGTSLERSSCEAIGEAARTMRAPVFTSPSALGVVSSEEPWFGGTFLNGNLEQRILGQSDAIITVGLDARDFFNGAWRYPPALVAFNERPDTQRFVPAAHQLVGSVTASLQALTSLVDKPASSWQLEDVAAYRRTVDQTFGVEDGSFTIPAALKLARRVLPPESVVAVDAGFGKPLASYLWTAPAPNRYFTAHGLSTMGYALPAANALQLVDRQRPAVAFMGDGSLLMRATEITVAAQHGLSPIVVVWMDGALAQIEVKQMRQQLRPVGARLPAVSCARVAEAFGGTGCDVETLDAFGAGLQAGLANDRPTLIGACVDQSRRAAWYELIRG